ncbi:MAG: O-acetyl-ADP-ribose deacetylase [Methanolinea sp.]|jgi:O-acetyl-ADP-ribose deacetylase (regulator of RNase III)|nr:O-acetyl-ADP-ribose deacetylase [Methanolinea sp.]
MQRPLYERVTVVEGDITEQHTDAIVNAANESLLGGSGVDGAIHRAAGPGLLRECRRLGGCQTGDAKITAGYNLPARFVIHAVGPVWQGGTHGEDDLLASCYTRALGLAEANGIKTIAFPAISTGAYGFPLPRAAVIAVRTVLSFLSRSDSIEQVIFVCHGKRAFDLYVDAIRELAGEYTTPAGPGVYFSKKRGNRQEVLREQVRAQLGTIEEVWGVRFVDKEHLARIIMVRCGDRWGADSVTAGLNSWVAVLGKRGDIEVPPGVLDRILDETLQRFSHR